MPEKFIEFTLPVLVSERVQEPVPPVLKRESLSPMIEEIPEKVMSLPEPAFEPDVVQAFEPPVLSRESLLFPVIEEKFSKIKLPAIPSFKSFVCQVCPESGPVIELEYEESPVILFILEKVFPIPVIVEFCWFIEIEEP